MAISTGLLGQFETNMGGIGLTRNHEQDYELQKIYAQVRKDLYNRHCADRQNMYQNAVNHPEQKQQKQPNNILLLCGVD